MMLCRSVIASCKECGPASHMLLHFLKTSAAHLKLTKATFVKELIRQKGLGADLRTLGWSRYSAKIWVSR